MQLLSIRWSVISRAEFEKTYNTNLEQIIGIREQKKEEIKNSLMENKKELCRALSFFERFFVKIVPEKEKLEQKQNFQDAVIFCPHCGIEINIKEYQGLNFEPELKDLSAKKDFVEDLS